MTEPVADLEGYRGRANSPFAVTVSLLRGEFADYVGNITEHPDVDYVQGDGRTYLARSDEEYDLIWFVAPDSYAASNAATAGAFVLSESYLYTKQMVDTAFDHLSPEGVLVTQFGDFDFDTRPTRTARYLVTARAALRDRIESPFADHTALVVERSDVDVGRASTIMVFKSPVEDAAVERLQARLGNVPNARPLFLPRAVREDGITADLTDLPDDEVGRLVADYPFDISAVDDGRPFFWHFTPFGDVLTNWERRYEDSEIAIGERLLLVLIMIGAVVAAVLLWLPFAVTRGRAAAVAGRWRFCVYFASLGLGFMLIEISMIQRFALLLGFPTLSLSVSLFTLLIATAVGARLSGFVRRWPGGGLRIVTAGLIVLAAVYMMTSEATTDAALSWPQWARITLVLLLLFPIGLLLGVFLPAGMDAVVAASDAGGGDRDRLVAWSWAVNGFFSVLGASVTTVISMTYGFDRAVLAGLVLYVVATSLLRVRPPRHAAVSVEVAEQPDDSAELVIGHAIRTTGDAHR